MRIKDSRGVLNARVLHRNMEILAALNHSMGNRSTLGEGVKLMLPSSIKDLLSAITENQALLLLYLCMTSFSLAVDGTSIPLHISRNSSRLSNCT